jgi:hypothetical protein
MSQPITPPDGMCSVHGEKDRATCWNCGGEGYSGHDCGEDCCCCLHPEDNVRCDICNGKGGWLICLGCHPEAAESVYGE